MPKVSDETIGKRRVELHVDRYSNWTVRTRESGTTIASAKTPEQALSNARTKLRDSHTQVAVPFKLSNGHTAIARRFSLKSGYDRKILCWMDDASPNGKRFQLATRNYGDPTAFKPDTPQHIFDQIKADQTTIQQLRQSAQVLETETRCLKEQWKLDLARVLEEELRKEPDSLDSLGR